MHLLVNLQQVAKEALERKKAILSAHQQALKDNDDQNKIDKPHYHSLVSLEINKTLDEQIKNLQNDYSETVSAILDDYSQRLAEWTVLDPQKARESVFGLNINLTKLDLDNALKTANGDYTIQRLALDYASANKISLNTDITVDPEKKLEAFKSLADSCLDSINRYSGRATDTIIESSLADPNADHWVTTAKIIELEKEI